MNCEQIRELLSPFVDGALDSAEAEEVEDHLRDCPSCRAERDRLISLHAALRAALHPDSGRSPAIADAVMSRISDAEARPDTTNPIAARSGRSWIGYAAAMAGGFLLAVIVLRPWPEKVGAVQQPVVARSETDRSRGESADRRNVIAARIVQAIGPVSVRTDGAQDWQMVSLQDLPSFACPADSGIKTPAGSLCELATTSGGRIRLNEATEIAIHSDSDVEFVKGQLWCRAPSAGTLNVIAPGSTETVAVDRTPGRKELIWQFSCPSDGSCFASVPESEPITVIAAKGAIDVTVKGAVHKIPAGATCRLTEDEVAIEQSPDQLLLAERWMQPLLALNGHGDPELERRVNALLSRLGAAKVSFLYEQDLRNLGEFGALPLLRFVQSEQSRGQHSKRRTAMRILKDVAPVWMLPELIELLDDVDPKVRSHAAQSLARLTGETQGIDFAEWEQGPEVWTDGVTAWKQWWIEHRLSCSPPPANVAAKSRTVAPELPPETLKARN